MRALIDLLRWPSPRGRDMRVFDGAILIGIVGPCLFIDTELVAVAIGLVWSVSGYFHLVDAAVSVLALLVGLPVAWLCGLVAILVFNAETDPANN